MPHGACLLYRPARGRPAGARPSAAGDRCPHRVQRRPQAAPRRGADRRARARRACAGSACPTSACRGFPPAFLEGMSSESRARILGDTGENAPEKWRWGRHAVRPRLARLWHDRGRGRPAGGESSPRRAARTAWPQPYRIPLVTPGSRRSSRSASSTASRSRSFAAPTRATRNNDPIHLVEPGEFIIGYPDNRDNLPPEPELSPLADPTELLPVADGSRDVRQHRSSNRRARSRRNGTYLVIRQLEQDVTAFWDYCWSRDRRLAGPAAAAL